MSMSVAALSQPNINHFGLVVSRTTLSWKLSADLRLLKVGIKSCIGGAASFVAMALQAHISLVSQPSVL